MSKDYASESTGTVTFDSPPAHERVRPPIGQVYRYLQYLANPVDNIDERTDGGPHERLYFNLLQEGDETIFWTQTSAHPDGTVEEVAGIAYSPRPLSSGSEQPDLTEFGISQFADGFRIPAQALANPLVNILLDEATNEHLFHTMLVFLECSSKQLEAQGAATLEAYLQASAPLAT